MAAFDASTSPAMLRILTIANDQQTLDRVASGVSRGGGDPVCALGLSSLPPGPVPFRFVVLATDGSPALIDKLAPRLHASAELVTVAPRPDLEAIVSTLNVHQANHITYGDEAGMESVAITVRKFVTGDLFGIEHYLPPKSEVRLTRLRDFAGRQAAIEEVLERATASGLRSRLRDQLSQVCEELLMNALYDAPIDEEGNLVFGNVDGATRVEQLSPRPVTIRHAAVPGGFAISVRDRFGRLDKATVLRFVDKCLHSSEQIDRKTYGAGLGLYLVCRAANQLVINVAPGMATEVICSFDAKQVRAGLRLVSVFTHPGTAAPPPPPGSGR